MNIDFPLHFDRNHRVALAGEDDHLRDLIEQLLFTNPGERVNRPDFGSGLIQLVFAPNSAEVAAALQFTVEAAIQTWLGDLLQLEELTVTSEEGTLRIVVRYIPRRSGQARSDTFTWSPA